MREDQKCRAAELQKSGNYQDALDAYRALADAAPTNDERAAALIGASGCLDILGRLPEARESLHDASRLMDHTPESLMNLAYLDALLDAKERNEYRALAKLNKILIEFSKYLETPEFRYQSENIQIQRAYRLLNLGRWQEASKLFDESDGFSVQEPEEFEMRKAYCLARCGEFARAHQVVGEVLNRSSDANGRTAARYYLGLVLYCEGKLSDALTEFRFCEQHLDNFRLSIPGLMDCLAMTSEALGQKEEAARYRRASGR